MIPVDAFAEDNRLGKSKNVHSSIVPSANIACLLVICQKTHNPTKASPNRSIYNR